MKISKRRTLKIFGLFFALITIVSSANAFADATGTATPNSAADAVSFLFAGSDSGITTISGSEFLYGNVKTFTSLDLGFGSTLSNNGVVLSSATTCPSEVLYFWMPCTGDLTYNSLHTSLSDILAAAEAASNNVTDISALGFSFDTIDPVTTQISLSFLFASSEISGANFPDVAAIIVDGVNYARMPNGSILVVNPSSDMFAVGQPTTESSCWFQNGSAQPYALNGHAVCELSPTQSLYAALDPALAHHTIAFVVGDVTDRNVPSQLAFTLPHASFNMSRLFVVHQNALDTVTVSHVDTGSAVVTFADALYPSTYTANVYDKAGTLLQTIANITSGSSIYGLSASNDYQITITATSDGLDDVTATASWFTTEMVKSLVADGKTPTLSSSNGFLVCELPQYFLDGQLRSSVTPDSVIYSLLVDGERVSTLSSDNFISLPRWILDGNLGDVAGLANLYGAEWKLADLTKYSASGTHFTCDAIIVKSNTSANAESNTLTVR
jgi:hypothetical protein